MDSEDKASTSFHSRFEQFNLDVTAFTKQARPYMSTAVMSDLVRELRDGINTITHDVAVLSAAKSASAIVSSTPPPSSSASKAAPIIVDIPSFDGDPTKWDTFERMFRAAINTRGAGMGNPEIRATLIKSLSYKPAKDLVPDTP